jgi:hypothetical protein
MNNIIYSGDSFVWGEGLELYIDTPYWKSQREIYNEWIGDSKSEGLLYKQTPETNKFREENRFSGLIEKKLGFKSIVNEDNGGDWHSSRLIIEENLSLNTKYIIHFFTSIDRNFLHSDIDCNCDFCKIDKPKPFNVYVDYIHRVVNNKPIDEWTQNRIDYLEKYEGIPKFDLKKMLEWEKNGDIITYLDFIFHPHRQRNLDYHIEKLKNYQKTTKLYLIDSWCNSTSFDFIRNNSYIESLLVPLKGYDGNYYKFYEEWESTFPYKRISKEFPNTKNEHPTLIQHQYLADSILEHIEKDTTEINPIPFVKNIF